jgi:dihydropyrimidinase
LVRGREVVADGEISGKAGTGRWLSRDGGWAAEPTGHLSADMNPERNFGAVLL